MSNPYDDADPQCQKPAWSRYFVATRVAAIDASLAG